jgi:replication-associated recombination protein RarA
MLEEYLWVEKYRPKRIADTILPVELKTTFQTFVDQKNVPNLLLSGEPGVGKTTVARAMLEELECDYIVINGSMNGNIDTLRNEILNFASAVSLGGGRKYIVLDESDYLNCLHEEQSVLLADGNTIKLKDMDDEKEYQVLSYNSNENCFEIDTACVISRIEKEVFEIEMEDGVSLKVTADHPICVQDTEGNISYRTLNDGLDGYNIITKI